MSDTTPVRRASSSTSRRPLEPAQQLAFDDVATEGHTALVARGAAYVRRYMQIQGESTILLRNVAVVLVALRSLHTTADGDMDLVGRSQAYRDDAAEIYREAGMDVDSQTAVQSAVRYHIGNILREVYTPDTLVAYGLARESPLERSQLGKATTRALVDVARAESVDTSDTRTATADHIRLGSGVVGILNNMSLDHIRDRMTNEQRAKLDGQLAEAQEIIRRLRRATKTRSSEA